MHGRKHLATAVAFALGISAWNAHAVLERMGPVSTAPSIGGFPLWYQDTTGIALEFCSPQNQAEVDGGWCLLTPAEITTLPETFPTNFFGEHFWFAADAAATTAQGEDVQLGLALEAAFAVEEANPGDQIVFARIRLRYDGVPATGNYRFIHPYGEKTIYGVAGDRIRFTEDIGINCGAGQFDCAMQSALGPFLLPSNTPGGAELAPVSGPVPGKLYIADPGRSGPVTGSSLPNFIDSTGASRNHNIFRIEGPPGSGIGGPGIDYVETANFSLMGRLFTGAMPGRVEVDRASYARNSTQQKLDVFATGAPTAQGRLPGQPRPATVMPQLSFFDAPCAGTETADGEILPPYRAPSGARETPMGSIAPGLYWAQIEPASIPREVCVKDAAARDAAGNVVPQYLPKPVADELTITEATFDVQSGTLSVKASSSEEVDPPTMSLVFGSYQGEMQQGSITVAKMTATPSRVSVLSSAGGREERSVRTTFAGTQTPPPNGETPAPVAVNDAYAVAEDAAATVLDILANDRDATGGTVTLTSWPRLGTAAINPDGSVSYRPSPDVNGSDQFTYTVSANSQVSNTGIVSVEILPANDAPVAVDDAIGATVNVALTIPVLDNDTDVDGKADLFAPTNVTQPSPGGATVSLSGNAVIFTASAAGRYTFTYQAQDAAGAVSANAATVTVDVAGAETIDMLRADYVLSRSRLRAEGTISPAANQTVTIEFIDAGGSVLGTAGRTVATATGTWVLDTVVALPGGATGLRARTASGTADTQALRMR